MTPNQQPVRGEYYEFKYTDDPSWYLGQYMGEAGNKDGYCMLYGDRYYFTKVIRPKPTEIETKIQLIISDGNLLSPDKAKQILSLVQNSGELTVREVCEKLKEIDMPYVRLIIHGDESNSIRYGISEVTYHGTSDIADLTDFVRKGVVG
jgi:uncharacterized protein with NRDE domain